MTEFTLLNLACTAGAFAELALADGPLLKAISASALHLISAEEGDTRAIATTAWACASLGCTDEPLLEAIAAAARRSRKDSRNASGLLLALFRGGHPDGASSALLAWLLQGVPLDIGALGAGFMLAEWAGQEPSGLGLQLAMPGSQALGLPPALALLAERAAGSPGLAAPPHSGGHDRGGYAKLARMLELVEAEAGAGGAGAVLAAVEAFAARGSWLKVAGDDKAAVLASALLRSPPPSAAAPLALELGAFVGYTAVRLAWQLGVRGCRAGGVVSLELDAVHVLLARHLLSLACESSRALVWTGLVGDTLARLPEAFGQERVDFTFMDHRGTRFHDDICIIESLRQQAPSSACVADNVAKPGAPLCLWHLPRSGRHSATAWSLLEFLHTDAEDWMLVSVPLSPSLAGTSASA